MDLGLRGKTALVTAASKGLGRAVATELAREGARVVISSRDEETLAQTAAEIREETWMPSARSVAFIREAFDSAGGYPEWLDLGEDMYLDRRWRALGTDMRLARDAGVFRRPRPTLAAYWRQFAGYARGDALGRMHGRRHAARFAAYGALVAALATRRRGALIAAVAAWAVYAARPLRRVRRLLPDEPSRLAASAAIPPLMALTDLAKMAGYLQGLARRRSR